METCQAWPCDPCSSRSTRIGCRPGAWTEEFLDHKKFILSAVAEEEEKEKEEEEKEEEKEEEQVEEEEAEEDEEKEEQEEEEAEEEEEEDRKNKKRAFLESIHCRDNDK
ncbi:hypothetical protein M8J77_020572 [Diaphorina citri]|nr:hypothetical protein M8J77_020572 [Diaphorina citri]